MQIISMDHIVLTTADLDKCLAFYVGLLGMQHTELNGHHFVSFGNQKINIHTRPAEFMPAAAHPLPGALDICLTIGGNINTVREEILVAGYPIEQDICIRNGAMGKMQSIYLYDPDGNLIELSSY